MTLTRKVAAVESGTLVWTSMHDLKSLAGHGRTAEGCIVGIGGMIFTTGGPDRSGVSLLLVSVVGG